MRTISDEKHLTSCGGLARDVSLFRSGEVSRAGDLERADRKGRRLGEADTGERGTVGGIMAGLVGDRRTLCILRGDEVSAAAGIGSGRLGDTDFFEL